MPDGGFLSQEVLKVPLTPGENSPGLGPHPILRRSRSHGRSRSRSPARFRYSWDDANNPGNTLYVTGLSTRVTEKDLECHFSKEGKARVSCSEWAIDGPPY